MVEWRHKGNNLEKTQAGCKWMSVSCNACQEPYNSPTHKKAWKARKNMATNWDSTNLENNNDDTIQHKWPNTSRMIEDFDLGAQWDNDLTPQQCLGYQMRLSYYRPFLNTNKKIMADKQVTIVGYDKPLLNKKAIWYAISDSSKGTWIVIKSWNPKKRAVSDKLNI